MTRTRILKKVSLSNALASITFGKLGHNKEESNFSKQGATLLEVKEERSFFLTHYKYLLLILIGLFAFFAIQHLGKFITVDEEKWLLHRIEKLYKSWATQNWSKTLINDKPGIVPAFLAGFVNHFTHYSNYGPLNFDNYLFYWRLPIVIFNTLLLFIIYPLGKLLIDKKFALLLTLFIALSPILIGITQIVNPDSTLWSTTFICFLAFLVFVKTIKYKYALLSAGFLVLALLSKFNCTIFYFLFFAIIYAEYLFGYSNRKLFLKQIVGMSLIFVISIMGYFALVPATWLDLSLLWKGTINAKVISSVNLPFFIVASALIVEATLLKGIFSRAIIKYVNLQKLFIWVCAWIFLSISLFLLFTILIDSSLFDFEYIRYNTARWTKNFIPSLLASSYTTLLTLSVPVIAGIGLFFIRQLVPHPFFKNLVAIQKNDRLRWSVYALLCIVLFLVGTSIIGFIAQTRYQVMLYPMYAFIAATTLSAIQIPKIHFDRLFIASALILILEIAFAYPFYYSFTNVLNIKQEVITDAWGFGGYELAQKANQLPNAENMIVWADRQGFKEFFVGTTFIRNALRVIKDPIDAVVLSYNGAVFNDILDDKLNNNFFNERTLEKSDIDEKHQFLNPLYKKAPLLSFNINGNTNNFINFVEVDAQPQINLYNIAYRKFSKNAVAASNKLNIGAQYSISFWLKTIDHKLFTPFIAVNTTTENIGLYINDEMPTKFYDGALGIDNTLGSESTRQLITDPVNDDAWHHLVIYQKGGAVGSEYGVYVDGELSDSSRISEHLFGNMEILLNTAPKGVYDDIRLYNKSISLQAVKELYNSGINNFSHKSKELKNYSIIELPNSEVITD